MTVGQVTKIFIALVAIIVLANAVYFAFNYNLWLGVCASIVAVIASVGLYNFVKKPSTDGRFW